MKSIKKPSSRLGAAPALLAVTAAVTVMPQAAVAYVGPGAGLTAIGTMIALIAALLLALMGFVWYPVKRMLRARKAESARPEVTSRPRVTSRAEVTSAQDR